MPNEAATPQPPPQVIPDGLCVQDAVIDDLRRLGYPEIADDIAARKIVGFQKYGTVLQPFNGRDAAVDAYQELLDAANYFKQAILEGRGFVFEYYTVLELLSSVRRFGVEFPTK